MWGRSHDAGGRYTPAILIVEVLHFAGCPNAADTLALVRRCVARLGLATAVVERDGDHPSPTVLVNGRDVMGEPATAERACRLDVPTEAHIMSALTAALEAE